MLSSIKQEPDILSFGQNSNNHYETGTALMGIKKEFENELLNVKKEVLEIECQNEGDLKSSSAINQNQVNYYAIEVSNVEIKYELEDCHDKCNGEFVSYPSDEPLDLKSEPVDIDIKEHFPLNNGSDNIHMEIAEANNTLFKIPKGIRIPVRRVYGRRSKERNTEAQVSHNYLNYSKDITSEREISCSKCLYRCSANEELKTHCCNHPEEKHYLCNLCDFKNTTKLNLLYHNKANGTFEKHFSCHICPKIFVSEAELQTHVRKHTGEKRDKCDFCGFKAAVKDNLVSHVCINDGDNKSDYCDFSSATKSTLIAHKIKQTVDKPYKCSYCNFSTATKHTIITHTRKHTGEKPYKCDKCDFSSVSKNTLLVHIRKHTGEKPYKCEYCDFKSTLKYTLTRHTRKHTGEKPYKCDYCDYRTTMKCTLTTHTRKHTGEKPYKCDYCDFRSTLKFTLIAHTRKHTGEKPYKCDYCYFSSTIKSTLIAHIRKHTGEKPYKCDHCDFRTTMKTNLITHTRKHTGEKPYQCDYCDHRFAQKNNVANHIKAKHAVKNNIFTIATQKGALYSSITVNKTLF